MSADIIVIIILCLLGLAAQASRKYGWMESALRVIYCFAFVAELLTATLTATVMPAAGVQGLADQPSPWTAAIMWTMAVLTGLMLFKPCRRLLSVMLSPINPIINGQLAIALYRKADLKAVWAAERVFVPESIPHLNAFWIYITIVGSLLAQINPDNFRVPSISIPFPVPLDALFSYNFLGLIFLAVCGAGIFVKRKPREILERLGLVKPQGWQIGLAMGMIGVTFFYDWLWSFYTGSPSLQVGQKLATYNSGTFAASGAGRAAILALATGICAGVGEEILVRGGLQPVFGIVPAAFLHGVLHSQFQHSPILILQVAGWSCIMGVVRGYTNTTTTIITHATFNFLTTFLFAFNP